MFVYNNKGFVSFKGFRFFLPCFPIRSFLSYHPSLVFPPPLISSIYYLSKVMAAQAIAQFRFSPLSSPYNYNYRYTLSPSLSLPLQSPRHPRLHPCFSFSSGDGIGRGIGGGGGGGGGGGDSNSNSNSDSDDSVGFGVLGIVVNGWRSRVAADPQFPFKVLMEELVGVSAAVAGDMATRPNFGLNELDFVFSTLVVHKDCPKTRPKEEACY